MEVDLSIKLHSSDELRGFLLVIVEVPEADLVARRHHQLVVLIVQVDGLGVGVELEEQLFGDQVVLVDELVHGDQEEVSVRLAAHHNVVDLGFWRLERQLVVVDFDALHTFDSDERALGL